MPIPECILVTDALGMGLFELVAIMASGVTTLSNSATLPCGIAPADRVNRLRGVNVWPRIGRGIKRAPLRDLHGDARQQMKHLARGYRLGDFFLVANKVLL